MTFEEKIYSMFDSIWDCEIDHPAFQDTVGELMEAVIQAYHVALKSEIIHCEDCKHFRRWIDTDICFCDITETEMSDNDFCSKAERRTDE